MAEERRRIAKSVDLQELGIPTPAQNRFDSVGSERLTESDAEWRKKDISLWDTEYRDDDHHKGVASAVAILCTVEGSRDKDVCSAALQHDISKTNPFFAYLCRRRKNFNWFEKWLMGWHPLFSFFMIWNERSIVRREQRREVLVIATLALFHHKPYWLWFSQKLRLQAWKIKYGDGFQSRCEDRPYRNGLPKLEALETSIKELSKEIPWWAHKLFKHEIEYMEGLMRRAFGQPDQAA